MAVFAEYLLQRSEAARLPQKVGCVLTHEGAILAVNEIAADIMGVPYHRYLGVPIASLPFMTPATRIVYDSLRGSSEDWRQVTAMIDDQTVGLRPVTSNITHHEGPHGIVRCTVFNVAQDRPQLRLIPSEPLTAQSRQA